MTSGPSSSGHSIHPRGSARWSISTPDRLQQFQEQGFLFPFSAFGASTARRLLADFRAYRRTLNAVETLCRLQGVYKPHLLAEWADRIVRDPRVLRVVRTLLGPNIMAWSMDVFVRPPSGAKQRAVIAPRGLAWHQDCVYLGLEPQHRIVRTWLALTPAIIRNGTMRFLPQSHLLGQLTHRRLGTTGERVRLRIDEADALPVELEPGQFSVHDIRLVHDSGENHTRQERVCVAVTYIGTDVRPVNGEDSAMLVRGRDAFHHFAHERRPRAEFSSAALRAYLGAVDMRAQRITSLAGGRS